MANTIANKTKNKKLMLIMISVILVVAIVVPIIIIAVSSSSTPLSFLMKKDLSEYVNVSLPGKINYSEVRESLKSGYDVFRVGITETYFGKTVYVEEGSTLDFTLSAELVTESEGGVKQYTTIELPEEYAKIKGYRPYSKAENLFFDKALAEVGEKDESGIDYMERDKASKFTLQIPEEERFGVYAGRKIRFTITVTDYVARYVYIYGGSDNSIGIIGDWFCKISQGVTQPTEGAAVKEGDVIIYDCVDTFTDGTVNEYKDVYMEVTSEYLSYFEGKKAGEKFTETVNGINEEFTIKSVYRSEDISAAIKNMGYNSVFELKEELRMWCYAVYSDGFMAMHTKKTELISYPKQLIDIFTKLEDQTWEVEFRQSVLQFAANFGDDVTLEYYGVTEFDTAQAYIDDMLSDHVNTLVRELVISYSLAKQLGILEDLYKRYDDSIINYMEQQQFSSRREALEMLANNADEACIMYTNFLSPILGTKFAELVEGANFTEFIKDTYVK